MKGIFISGTDTGVGKTIASAVLLIRASHHYKRIAYHKPVQTGAPLDSDKDTVKALVPSSFATNDIALKKPLSPHLAAHYQKHYIEFRPLVENTKRHCESDFTIVEGAGGLMVPINNRYLMIDFIQHLGLPCVLVVRSTLGTINHTLLSLEALHKRRIPLQGVIMMGKNVDNQNSIKLYGKVKNLVMLPFLKTVNHDSLSGLVAKNAKSLDTLFTK